MFTAGALTLLLGLTFFPGADTADTVRVEIDTSLGVIRAELYPAQAPGTVANFLRYVDSGLYRDGHFHRVVRPDNQPNDSIRIEVIQGGPDTERPGFHPFDPIEMETTAETGLRHRDGTLSMARSGPHTATHGFFITLGEQPELDHGGVRNPDGFGFAAFGQVVEGMEVVRAIQALPAEGQTLREPVLIREVRRWSSDPGGYH